MMKVLVVDDSVVFRSQITNSLAGIEGVEVVGSAPNGRIALQKLEQMSVDLVTLDMEMPEMDGLETLKHIREKKFPVKVIVFSSQTTKGAERALDALTAGADDIVAKPSSDNLNIESSKLAISELLVPRVLQFVDPMLRKLSTSNSKPTGSENEKQKNDFAKLKPMDPEVIVIASSTGGPTALEEIFRNFKFPVFAPIFIAQHMPPVFTDILAKRLASFSQLDIAEAKHGELVRAGSVRVCPGNFHLKIGKSAQGAKTQLTQDPHRNSVRPAADYLFETAAESFKENCLGVVLTGMGEDGKLGSQSIKSHGGSVIIQEKSSCTVFGMPGAVYEAGFFDEICSLSRISELFNKWKRLGV